MPVLLVPHAPSTVFELDGCVIGNIMYTKASLIREDGVSVPAETSGPLRVDPEYQRRGYPHGRLRASALCLAFEQERSDGGALSMKCGVIGASFESYGFLGRPFASRPLQKRGAAQVYPLKGDYDAPGSDLRPCVLSCLNIGVDGDE